MLSLNCYPIVTQKQVARLSQEQRQKVISYILSLQLQLIADLNMDQYEPSAVCNSCGHSLTAGEIVKGFRHDPYDRTTKCPKCGVRLLSYLEGAKSVAGRAIIDFYCPIQALHELESMYRLLPGQIQKSKKGVYYSAIIHFGGLKGAFRELDIEYPYFDKIEAWEEKVTPYLGKVSDKFIGNAVGVSPDKVSKLRKRLQIPKLRVRDLLDSEP